MRQRLRLIAGQTREWLIRTSRGRLSVAVAAWLIVLGMSVMLTDPIVWTAFAIGVLCPVSLLLAYRGDWLPRPSGLHGLLNLTPRQFEEIVADLLQPLGYSEIRLTGGPGDMGVDVLGRDAAGSLVAIQCKRYQPDRDISSSAVQTFMGGMVAHKADSGIIVTTSEFSAPARALATAHGIRLIDGLELSRLIHEHNVPVEA